MLICRLYHLTFNQRSRPRRICVWAPGTPGGPCQCDTWGVGPPPPGPAARSPPLRGSPTRLDREAPAGPGRGAGQSRGEGGGRDGPSAPGTDLREVVVVTGPVELGALLPPRLLGAAADLGTGGSGEGGVLGRAPTRMGVPPSPLSPLSLPCPWT